MSQETGRTYYSLKATIIGPMIGSVACNLIQQPFDLVKIKLQSYQADLRQASSSTTSTTPRYTPTINSTAKAIYKEGGIKGFYRGSMINFIGSAILTSIRWSFNTRFTKYNDSNKLIKNDNLRVLAISTAIGLFQCVGTLPMDNARLKMNSIHYKGLYYSQLDGMIKIGKKYGMRGLYHGIGITTVRDITFSFLVFRVYELFVEKFHKMGKRDLGVMIGGVACAMTAWIIAYPLDTLKTVIQSDSLDMPSWTVSKYLRYLKENNKLPSLYLGLNSVLIRCIPINVVYFTVWDRSMRFIDYLEAEGGFL